VARLDLTLPHEALWDFGVRSSSSNGRKQRLGAVTSAQYTSSGKAGADDFNVGGFFFAG
jgi:hypothetical protein